MNNLDNTKFNDLTEEQLNEMTGAQMVNKALSEYVDEINNHVKAIKACVKHLLGSSIITILSLLAFGVYGLIGLLPILFFAYWIFNFKKSIVWHVRSFKSTASMYNICGFEDLVSIHEDNINHSVLVGEFYKIK